MFENLENAEGNEDFESDIDQDQEIDQDDTTDEITDSGTDGEESDGEDGDNDEPETYEVNGDQVTISELKNGYMRQSDYTRSKQSVAKELKAAQSLSENLTKAVEVAEKMLLEDEEAINWDDMTESEQLSKQRELRKREKAVNQAKKARDAAIKEIANKQASVLHDVLNWSNPENKQRDIKLLNSYISNKGLSSEDLSNVVDHRILEAFIKAQKYDDLQKSNPRQHKKAAQKLPKSKSNSKKGGAAPKKTLAQVLYG